MVRGISGNVSYEGDIDINVSHPFGTASTSYDTCLLYTSDAADD